MQASKTFRALITRAKKTPATVETLTKEQLPQQSTVKTHPGECQLRVAVSYSSLNYKDALVATGTYPGLKAPMVGGIDLVGQVVESKSDQFKSGDRILVNGFGIGTDHYGGYAEEAQISADWALKLPEGLSELNSQRIGTAGYTAMLCVDALQRNGVKPDMGPILVTGATGGVGSVSIALLSELGYSVVALTGKAEATEAWLKQLGASEVKSRSDFDGEPRPLNKELYAGGVDSCGDKILAHLISHVKYSGAVAACGLAGGMALNTTVAPFILRGVQLAGVDSVFAPMPVRKAVYDKFTPLLLKSNKLDLVSDAQHVLSLEQVPEVAGKMLKGNIQGRYVVKVGEA